MYSTGIWAFVESLCWIRGQLRKINQGLIIVIVIAGICWNPKKISLTNNWNLKKEMLCIRKDGNKKGSMNYLREGFQNFPLPFFVFGTLLSVRTTSSFIEVYFMYLDHCDYWSKGGANQLQGVCKCRKFPIAWCWQIWSAVSGVFAEKIWGSWLSTNQNINREWKVKHTLCHV